MPNNPIDNSNSDSKNQENKKQKIVKNENLQEYWTKLPSDVKNIILDFAHHDEQENQSNGLLPNYAMVNKECYRFFSSLTTSSYEIMVHCLIGPEGSKRLVENKNISINDPKSAFLYIKRQVNELAKKIDFGYITKVLTTDIYSPSGIKSVSQIDYFNGYDFDTKRFNIQLIKEASADSHQDNENQDMVYHEGFYCISRNKLLDYLFNITSIIKQELNLLTPNPDCYPALMAFAYLATRKKDSDDFMHLAVLYAEAGFIRGTLFILEFSQTYQLWNKHNSSRALSQSHKKDALTSVLYTSLSLVELGGNIAKHITNRYKFKHKTSTVYACITDAYPCMSAFNILLLDFRHYESPAEFLKAVLIAAWHISKFYRKEIKNRLLQPNETEALERIDTLVKNYFSQLSYLPESMQYFSADTEQIDSLDGIRGFEQGLFDTLNLILDVLENDTKDFDLNLLLGHLFTVENNEHAENIADLQPFYEPSKAEKDHLLKDAKFFINEARKLYKLINSVPQNTSVSKTQLSLG